MTIDFDGLELSLAEFAAAGGDQPRPEVKAGLMAQIRAETPAVPEGFSFRFAATDQWVAHPVPGIRMRVLAMNRENGYATLLLDAQPGTRFPAHRHTGAEECYVVAGSLYTCDRHLRPGDFVHADEGTDHGGLWTEEGVQVILIVPPEDYIADVPR